MKIVAEGAKPAGMAPASSDNRMQIITTPEFLRQVDEWRRQQADIPNRSEAIRRMVAIASGKADAEKAGQ